MKEDPGLLDQVFWSVFLADFTVDDDCLGTLLPLARAAVVKGALRQFNKGCEEFLANAPGWPRYDEHLTNWQLPDPRLPEFEDGEEIISGSFREAGELLAHRVIMTYYAQREFERYRANVDDRPYWRLVIVDDGRTRDQCKLEALVAHRHDAPYWKRKKLPCEQLFCRCGVTALMKPDPPKSTA